MSRVRHESGIHRHVIPTEEGPCRRKAACPDSRPREAFAGCANLPRDKVKTSALSRARSLLRRDDNSRGLAAKCDDPIHLEAGGPPLPGPKRPRPPEPEAPEAMESVSLRGNGQGAAVHSAHVEPVHVLPDGAVPAALQQSPCSMQTLSQ